MGRRTQGVLLPIEERLLEALRGGPKHGYGLHAELVWWDDSAVYRALRRLETGGLIESAWQHRFSGLPRRVYQLPGKVEGRG